MSGTFGSCFVESPPYHATRARSLLKRHPEVKKLSGPNPWSGVYLLALVVLQLAIQALLSGFAVWVQLVAAYAVGAFVLHALWMLVHEAAHDLIFHSKVMNRWAAIVANLPMLLPATISFSIYHQKHHAKFSFYHHDTDVPSLWEAWLLRGGFFRRLVWAAVLPFLFQGFRRSRVDPAGLATSWQRFVLPNVLIQWCFVVAWVATWYGFTGRWAIWYLAGSAYFSNALHPLVGRWIQEHFVAREGQETNSYYGGLNLISFNIGYHNEHHDCPFVPWNRLPALRRIASEMYEPLFAYKSWTVVLLKFLFDKNLQVYRLARDDGGAKGDDAGGPDRPRPKATCSEVGPCLARSACCNSTV